VTTPGQKFRDAVQYGSPLCIVGTINAFTAMLADRAGFRAIYLSGAGVANASYGRPDLGITKLADVLEDVRRITGATDLPLLVDVDTCWNAADETARQMILAGAAAMQLEDQVEAKRCGHRPGKQLVSTDEMVGRVLSAVEGRTDPTFVIMARTDAVAVEGLEAAINRANKYVSAGADMIFAEAVETIDDLARFTKEVGAPVLANMTEFGVTPAFTTEQLGEAGIAMALFPLSAFRAMNLAAEQVYASIMEHGTSARMLGQMQTREQLYDVLDYYKQESSLNEQRLTDDWNST
jgi:methylisocitrate lyase